jgi:ankyrin repeat protein
VLKDGTNLSTLNAKPGQTFIMMGIPSVDAAIITTPKEKVKFMEDMTNAEAAKLEGATLVGLQSPGVDPEDEGDVTLNEASEKGHEKTVHQLLKEGADVNAKNGYDETPLFSVRPVADTRRW